MVIEDTTTIAERDKTDRHERIRPVKGSTLKRFSLCRVISEGVNRLTRLCWAEMPVAASVIRRHGPFVTSVVRQMEPRAFRPIKPLVEVDDAFACDEGEGDGTQAWVPDALRGGPELSGGRYEQHTGTEGLADDWSPKGAPAPATPARRSRVRLDGLLTLCP